MGEDVLIIFSVHNCTLKKRGVTRRIFRQNAAHSLISEARALDCTSKNK